MEVQTTEKVIVPSDTLGGKENMRFSSLVQEFCSEYAWEKGWSKPTIDNYKWTRNSFLKAVKDKELDELGLDDVREWRKWMDSHNYEQNCQNAYLYKFRCLIKYANKKHECGIDPDDIVIPKKTQTAPKFLTVEEINRLVQTADKRGKAIIALLYSTGMRVGELARVRKTDLRGDTIVVRGKGKKERYVFIDDRAKQYLQEYLDTRADTNPMLFNSKKCRGVSVSCIQKIVKDTGVNAGISVSPHVLRHSYATHMAQSGISAFHLQGLLGHSHLSTTQIYVHSSGKDLRTAHNMHHKQFRA